LTNAQEKYRTWISLRTGFQAVNGDVAIIQDADLEYNQKKYPTLVEPITSNVADVSTDRVSWTGAWHRVLCFWHSSGNRFLTLLSNMLQSVIIAKYQTSRSRKIASALSQRSPQTLGEFA
jgi:hypothetical protein